MLLELGRSPVGGNGNPLQCPCLENPMDRGAWRAAVPGFAESRTGLGEHACTQGPALTPPLSQARAIPATLSVPGFTDFMAWSGIRTCLLLVYSNFAFSFPGQGGAGAVSLGTPDSGPDNVVSGAAGCPCIAGSSAASPVSTHHVHLPLRPEW